MRSHIRSTHFTNILCIPKIRTQLIKSMKFTWAKFCFFLFSVILLSNASLSQSFNHDHEEVQRSQFSAGFLFGASISSFHAHTSASSSSQALHVFILSFSATFWTSFTDMFNFRIKVEGAYLEDGKSLSNLDIFSHIPGKQRTKLSRTESLVQFGFRFWVKTELFQTEPTPNPKQVIWWHHR